MTTLKENKDRAVIEAYLVTARKLLYLAEKEVSFWKSYVEVLENEKMYREENLEIQIVWELYRVAEAEWCAGKGPMPHWKEFEFLLGNEAT
ncbi:hypothetical protein M1N58_00135 [Dehalococcoidales bacterium]|nr:hypothetical protein [Dehalococcoidales bacterium]